MQNRGLERTGLFVVVLVLLLMSAIPIVFAQKIADYEDRAREAIEALPDKITLADLEAVFNADALTNEALRMGGLAHFIGNVDVLESAVAELRAELEKVYRKESLFALKPAAWLDGELREMSERFAVYDDPESWAAGRFINGETFGDLLVYSRGHRDLNLQPQWIEYDLTSKGYKYLEGYVGIIDTSSALSFPPSFTIFGEIDGKQEILFHVDELYRDEPAYHYFLDVSKVQKIRFHIESEVVSGNRWTNRFAIVEPIFYIEK